VADSLQILGFEPIPWSGLRLEISRLIVIGPTAPTGNFRSGLLRRLRQKLLVTPPLPQPDQQAIYISRADAAQRFIENEAELFPILDHAADGIVVKVVQLEGRSLADQIQLFQACRLLVGLHGAGLTNMLWMPTGSHVIEIRRRGDDHNNCYFAMACALGHRYSYVQADDVLPGQSTQSARLHLDPVQLKQVLNEALPC
jgi:capsular polysaccharide biosynthesis protein